MLNCIERHYIFVFQIKCEIYIVAFDHVQLWFGCILQSIGVCVCVNTVEAFLECALNIQSQYFHLSTMDLYTREVLRSAICRLFSPFVAPVSTCIETVAGEMMQQS